ncbi:magnesium-translocating P-type ATPase [Agriterribacter sp.]|uniref:magnesium-translocating P-type ATPase n=1 Tax=Agriterribacter sp. TaxID=2821509 RepID=UPI002CE05FF8|nr:magnesium-translocating P-type ATPase [Agriterribacter sp.]HRO47542.1 magnesium-translocating P-type ATPase [Agriterribacter sp.]HRQ16999.1 magnesium-translocating P-type ATPase [Agriterribacter sp.]
MSDLDISSSSLEQLYIQLQSSPKGLPDAIAAERMKGQAKLFHPENRLNKGLKLLLRQFSSPLVLLLVIAIILSIVLGEYPDSFIILFILLATCLLGFWQELKAGKAIEQLQKLIEMKHTVLREGKQIQLLTAQIVVGDVLCFNAGDMIPADCRIIESNELHVNESSLTGESYPVEKKAGEAEENLSLSKRYNCLWHGTNVISGTATAMAVQTGKRTIFGRMTQSLAQIPETAFERGIRRFGIFLLKITVILSVIVLVANLYFHKPFFDSVLFSLALAVGMAPELLPAIMTFAMSIGAKRLMKKKVIVKKLSSVFNFGEVNVLCTDKTGTITEGNVRVKDIVNIQGKTNKRIRLYAFLNAVLQNGFTNPIDQAIASLNIPTDEYEKTDEIPYDFIRKRISIAVRKDARYFFVTKGAFSNVLNICDHIESEDGNREFITKEMNTQITNSFIAWSREGYRVLGLAYKELQVGTIKREDEEQMVFLGFILLEDPLKEGTPAAIGRLEELNINIKVITGDNRFAAAHAAQKIGMKDAVMLTGEEMRKLYPEALVVKAKTTDIFAEIEPQQKELIIKALQKSNLAVAYIGDGINDVAAINAADVGISTNNAVDIAKEAADFVLLEKDLSVLAKGIYEGRKCFTNSMKYIFITTGATFGNMFSVAGASLFLPFLPMLPKQILLTNLITDLPFLAIASDHVDDEQVVRPGKWNLKTIRWFMIVFGLHSSVFDFITFYVLYFYFHFSGSSFQTGWFLESVLTELLILFIIRTRKSFIKSKPGKLLLITGIAAFCVTLYLPFSPLAGLLGLSIAHVQQLIAIVLILLTYTITADLLKVAFFQVFDKKRRKEYVNQ